jgi:hypothetical protein
LFHRPFSSHRNAKEDVVRKTSAPRRTLQLALVAAALPAVALLGAGCAQPTPEERVAELRSSYEATLQNFVIRETPLVDPLIDAEPALEGEEAAAEEAPAEGGETALGEELIEEVPVRQDVMLDILVRHDNHENLPGLTVEVAQLGEGASEQMSWEEVEAGAKATWRIYLDTAAIGRGQGNSVVHTLEDLDDVTPGDRFVVVVRDPVPPGERGDYREFSEAS